MGCKLGEHCPACFNAGYDTRDKRGVSKPHSALASDLNSAITREIDTSFCSYEEVIHILQEQIRFMQMAKRQEHDNADPECSKREDSNSVLSEAGYVKTTNTHEKRTTVSQAMEGYKSIGFPRYQWRV